MTQYVPDPLAWEGVQWDGSGGSLTDVTTALNGTPGDIPSVYEATSGELVVLRGNPVQEAFVIPTDYWFVWLPGAVQDHPYAPAVKYRVVPNDSGAPSGWSAV